MHAPKSVVFTYLPLHSPSNLEHRFEDKLSVSLFVVDEEFPVVPNASFATVAKETGRRRRSEIFVKRLQMNRKLFDIAFACTDERA